MAEFAPGPWEHNEIDGQRDDESDQEVEPESWLKHWIWSQPDGSYLVRSLTNDDEDRGYPTTEAEWEQTYKSLAHALGITGVTRQGVWTKVEVYLDGGLYHGAQS